MKQVEMIKTKRMVINQIELLNQRLHWAQEAQDEGLMELLVVELEKRYGELIVIARGEIYE
jgi:hypothetical protein